ncbi:MAG: dimethylarginine dimethylaminohydrolase family protein [Candidatus Hodarchaeales archaeon]|jgi:N-dimethylarginine dimethylaminohydrolase
MEEFGCQSMIRKLEGVVIKHLNTAFISQKHLNKSWKAFNYISCPSFEKALSEFSSFEEILKNYVQNIYYLPYSTDVGLDSIYTHDPVKMTKKGAIILNMGKESRRNEPKVTKNFLLKIDIPILGSIKEPGKVEGGDLLWLDDRSLIVGRGYRTNNEGIRQIKHLTKEIVTDLIVCDLPHGDGPDSCLHLMSLISLIDRNLAVVYSRYLSVSLRELLIERGMTLIEVPDKEYLTLGSNILVIEPKLCIMMAGNPKTKKLLEDEGVDVLEYPGNEISIKGAGGPTCLTMPIIRK